MVVALKLVKLGFTLVSPAAPILVNPELIPVELRAPSLFILDKSWPRFDNPLLILSDDKLEFRLVPKVLSWFRLGFIAVRPELMLGRLKFSNEFDVVIAFEVKDARLVFKRDKGSPIFRPTPKVGVAWGKPMPVPEGLRGP